MTDGFLKKVKDAIIGDRSNEEQTSELDGTQQPGAHIPGQFPNVRPASEDPYGDPADQEQQGQFGNVRPASEDPYGDPADQQNA